jgi:hypothetical protein
MPKATPCPNTYSAFLRWNSLSKCALVLVLVCTNIGHCVRQSQNRAVSYRGGIIQGVLLYTMNPSKTARKSMGEWDYRTRIIPLLSSMKPAKYPYGRGEGGLVINLKESVLDFCVDWSIKGLFNWFMQKIL